MALTKLMLRKDNFLLLDEPTNHLDMDSCEVLEDALAEFPGVIFAISHDRYFVNRFAERMMVMAEDGITEYIGNFDDYLEKRDRPMPPETPGRRADQNRDHQRPEKGTQAERSSAAAEGRRDGRRGGDPEKRTAHGGAGDGDGRSGCLRRSGEAS